MHRHLNRRHLLSVLAGLASAGIASGQSRRPREIAGSNCFRSERGCCRSIRPHPSTRAISIPDARYYNARCNIITLPKKVNVAMRSWSIQEWNVPP